MSNAVRKGNLPSLFVSDRSRVKTLAVAQCITFIG